MEKEKKIHLSDTVHQKKISLTDSWIRAGFFRVKVVSDFDFEQFSTLLMEYLTPLTELSRWGGRSRILMILISQTLLALISCPPPILFVGLKKVILFSSPQWRWRFLLLYYLQHSTLCSDEWYSCLWKQQTNKYHH